MKDIKISALPEFVPNQSNLEQNSYVYSYKVKIKNNSDKTVQLINRHWRVYSAGVQIADVKGEGVVGKQPVLKPGQEFEYSSWTIVRDVYGEMKGEYTFHTEDGTFVDIEVPSFNLIYVSQDNLH